MAVQPTDVGYLLLAEALQQQGTLGMAGFFLRAAVKFIDNWQTRL
jgi:hypothetical protein